MLTLVIHKGVLEVCAKRTYFMVKELWWTRDLTDWQKETKPFPASLGPPYICWVPLFFTLSSKKSFQLSVFSFPSPPAPLPEGEGAATFLGV
jgi:hypothetical protein